MTAATPNKVRNQERALRTLNELPPLSPVLNKLLATISDEDVSFASVARLIEKDTILAGSVLRVVNSALYGCRGTISSVAHAISIMGLVKLRNTALSFSVSRLLKNIRSARSWSPKEFNLHSVGTAIMADELVQHIRIGYPEGAFAGGLFHDLGKLLMATAMMDEYEELRRLLASGSTNREEVERDLTGWTHPELSAAALEKWNLPQAIRDAVEFHHRPGEAPADADTQFTLAHVLNAADRLVNARGIQIAPAAEPEDAVIIYRAIGIEEHAQQIETTFEAQFAAIGSYF